MQRSAGIYVRISRDKAGGGLGVQRQLQDCRELAHRLGWPVVGIYEDNDISAYSGKPRPGYLRMLEDIKAGHIDGVIAWHTDRLHRSPIELETYIDLGVETQTVKAGLIDLATPAGRMVARQLGAVARYESEHRADRAKRKRLELATNGQFLGGPRPFGYESDGITIRPEEAHELQLAVKRVLAGESMASVRKDWQARGIKSTFGNDYSDGSFRALLLRDRNAGLLKHKGKVIGKASWEPLISETDHHALVSLIRDPSRRTSPGSERVHLLSGLARCGVCQKTMNTKATKKTTRYVSYTCCVSREKNKVDDHVTKWVLALLADERIVRSLTATDVDTTELEAEREAIKSRLDEAATLFSSGLINGEQLSKVSRDLLTRQEAIDASLSHSTRGSVLEGLVDVPTAWEGLSIERKQRIIDALMTVTILPLGHVGRRQVPVSEGVAIKLRTDTTPGIRTKIIGGTLPTELQTTLTTALKA